MKGDFRGYIIRHTQDGIIVCITMVCITLSLPRRHSDLWIKIKKDDVLGYSTELRGRGRIKIKDKKEQLFDLIKGEHIYEFYPD